MSAAKAAYYSTLIMNNKHNPRLLFDTVSKLTQERQPVTSITLSAQDFMEYINSKVEEIRSKMPHSNAGGADFIATLHSFTGQGYSVFEQISVDDLNKVVMTTRSTTCSLDPLPAWVV